MVNLFQNGKYNKPLYDLITAKDSIEERTEVVVDYFNNNHDFFLDICELRKAEGEKWAKMEYIAQGIAIMAQRNDGARLQVPTK